MAALLLASPMSVAGPPIGRCLAPAELGRLLQSLRERPVEGWVVVAPEALGFSTLEAARSANGPALGLQVVDSEDPLLHRARPAAADAPRSDRYDWGMWGVVRRVLTDHGDVVEVINDAPEDDPAHCYQWRHGADYRVELRTFVRKADLVPVLARQVEEVFNDGTRVVLAEGVTVALPTRPRRGGLATSGDYMHVEGCVPEDAVALSYEPGERNGTHRVVASAERMLRDDALLLIGGRRFARAARLKSRDLVRVAAAHDADGYVLVELSGACVSLVARVDPTDLVPPFDLQRPRPVLTPRRHARPYRSYTVPVTEPVLWPDGRAAGRLLMPLRYESSAAPVGGRVCFDDLPLGLADAICFAIDNILIEGPHPPAP